MIQKSTDSNMTHVKQDATASDGALLKQLQLNDICLNIAPCHSIGQASLPLVTVPRRKVVILEIILDKVSMKHSLSSWKSWNCNCSYNKEFIVFTLCSLCVYRGDNEFSDWFAQVSVRCSYVTICHDDIIHEYVSVVKTRVTDPTQSVRGRKIDGLDYSNNLYSLNWCFI